MERREFEYVRHGTVTLIGNFHVVTGELMTPTLGSTRIEENFVKHIERTIDLEPEARYVFELDNLNIHSSAGLEKAVARLCGKNTWGRSKKGVLKSVKTWQEFLADLSYRICFVCTRKHSSWLNQIEVVFGIIMRKVIRQGNFTTADNLRQKIRGLSSSTSIECFTDPLRGYMLTCSSRLDLRLGGRRNLGRFSRQCRHTNAYSGLAENEPLRRRIFARYRVYHAVP